MYTHNANPASPLQPYFLSLPAYSIHAAIMCYVYSCIMYKKPNKSKRVACCHQTFKNVNYCRVLQLMPKCLANSEYCIKMLLQAISYFSACKGNMKHRYCISLCLKLSKNCSAVRENIMFSCCCHLNILDDQKNSPEHT
jgi:hypothetical protein